MGYLWTTITLAVLYVALSGNVALNNALAGLVVGAGIAFLLRPKSSPMPLRRAPVALWALLRYAARLALDIILNGLEVARIVLDPTLPIKPAILAMPSTNKSELGLALASHAISVTPGSSVIGVDEDGTLYVHVLDATNAEETIAEARALRRSILDPMVE